MKKTVIAIAILALATAGLTACDPPIPDELLVLQAEKKHVCVDGTSYASAPTRLVGTVTGWSSALTGDCSGTTVTTKASANSANIVISPDKNTETCPTGYTFPLLADVGVITYSIPDVDSLTLSFATLAKIFDGSVKNWSADEIAAENPDIQLPNLPIVLNPVADKASLAAVTAWAANKKVTLKTDAFKPTDASFTPKTGAGSISVISGSQATKLTIPTISIILATASDGTQTVANPDETGAYEGASQWKVTTSDKGVSVATDYAATPSAPAGFDLAPSYQAAFPIVGVLCPGKQVQTQAVAYSWLRTDYQGTLGDSGYMALPTKVRAKTFVAIGKGLPAGK